MDTVTYAFIARQFKTERRYAEAIRLLWGWAIGRVLLTDAANSAVAVSTATTSDMGDAIGVYTTVVHTVRINRDYAAAPSWMLAATLAHELQHASDELHGYLQSRTSSDCYAREAHAFATQAAYVAWIRDQYGQLPSATAARTRLDTHGLELLADADDLLRHPVRNVEGMSGYQQLCRR